MFDFSEIKKLVELVQKSGISELEVTRFFSRVKIRREVAEVRDEAAAPGQASADPLPVAPEPPPPVPAPVPVVAPVEAPEEPLVPIRSPMVGTFYRAPAPDASAFVEVGQAIKRGQVVCIIEAMKLMNEIESEVDGTIVKVLVENAQPVQYDETLFLVKAG